MDTMKTLNEISVAVGLTLPMAFAPGWHPYPPTENNFREATVQAVRKNGKVKIVWNQLTDNGKFFPSVVIHPEHILVQI